MYPLPLLIIDIHSSAHLVTEKVAILVFNSLQALSTTKLTFTHNVYNASVCTHFKQDLKKLQTLYVMCNN